jgi:hypothetical protein
MPDDSQQRKPVRKTEDFRERDGRMRAEGRVLSKAIVRAAVSIGMVKEASAYLEAPLHAKRGRRPRPSKPLRCRIKGKEVLLSRVEVARKVHAVLGEPQIYEKLEHNTLQTAIRKVKRETGLTPKVIGNCYRKFQYQLQTEKADVDWKGWLKSYRAHSFAQVRSGKQNPRAAFAFNAQENSITRAQALKYWRRELLRQINRFANG